jgi:hypothetical protein
MLTPAHVELYCKIRADRAYCAGYRVDAAVVSCEQVERRLRGLAVRQQQMLLLEAMGWSQLDMAQALGFSLRTVGRTVKLARRAAYGELWSWIGVQRAPSFASFGQQRGRRGKVRAA